MVDSSLIESPPPNDRAWSFAGDAVAPLEKVSASTDASLGELCESLNIPLSRFLKAIVFEAMSPIPIRWVVAAVRGDHEVDEAKLADAAQALGITSLRKVDSPLLREKFAVGYVGPDAGTKIPDAVLIVDPGAAQGEIAWATSANEMGYFVKNFNWFREAGDKLADPAKVLVADIATRAL